MKKILIIFLALVTIFLRFYNLEILPNFLTNDEVAIAYNAYSISQSGTDEYGIAWPTSFKSFNDYKAPGYIYILAPLVRLAPATKITVRTPSAIAGCLTILFAGLLFYELTSSFTVAYLSSFMLSITPWHIFQSRLGVETNLALLFLTLGTWLFLKNKQYVSAIFMAISLYSYHTEKLFVPMFLFLNYYKQWKINWKFWLTFTVLLIPMFIDLYLQSLGSHPTDSKWFWTDPIFHDQITQIGNHPLKLCLYLFQVFTLKYIAYLNTGYLFVTGLNLFPNHSFIQSGLFLLPEIILLYFGIINFKKYVLPQYRYWLISYLILVPIVPALTIGEPNLNRYFIAVVPISLIAGIGLHWLATNSYNRVIKSFIITSLVVSFCFFCVLYFGLYRLESNVKFQSGYEEISHLLISKYYPLYDTIIIDPRFGETNVFVGAPHLYLAYFSKINPGIYHQNIGKSGLFIFDKYQIHDINWNIEPVNNHTLYIVPKDNFPQNLKYHTVDEIRLNDSVVEFKLIDFPSIPS